MKLAHTVRSADPRRRGSAILLAVFVAFAMASTAAVLMSLAQTDREGADLRRSNTTARYLALGALEAVVDDLQGYAQTSTAPPATILTTVDGEPVEVEVDVLGAPVQEFDDGGLMQFAALYHLTASASVDEVVETHDRIVEVLSVPVYQFALFWENDLEIWPGPDMTVGGRVHCNSDMYVGANNSLTLDTNYVRVIGDLRARRKHSPQVNTGDIRIRRWVADPFDTSEPTQYEELHTQIDMALAGLVTDSGYDSAFEGYDHEDDGDFYGPNDWLPFSMGALEKWSEPTTYAGGTGNTVQTADHGAKNADLTDVASLAMFEPAGVGDTPDYVWNEASGEYVEVAPGTGTHVRGPFHESAGLAILTKEDGSFVAIDGDGNDVTVAVSAAVKTESLYDARQAEGGSDQVEVTVVDLQRLSDSGHYPANGLLYAGKYGAGEGTDAGGLRITNGSELAGPLSVVSENSVYVHGDYNVVDKKPAAVLGDAVHLLSNAWDGTKSKGTLPTASDTTYQMAIVGGNTPSAGGVYSGGVENFPRLHEKWSGKNLRIVGSMICPWESVYATSPWSYGGDDYTAPVRDWFYDPDFNDPDNLPPFALVSATVRNAVTW